MFCDRQTGAFSLQPKLSGAEEKIKPAGRALILSDRHFSILQIDPKDTARPGNGTPKRYNNSNKEHSK